MNQYSSLLELLNELAIANRQNAVEEAMKGRGIGETNFKGQWDGYSLNNKPTVIYNGKKYNTTLTATKGAPLGSNVYMRVGKDVKFTDWK